MIWYSRKAKIVMVAEEPNPRGSIDVKTHDLFMSKLERAPRQQGIGLHF